MTIFFNIAANSGVVMNSFKRACFSFILTLWRSTAGRNSMRLATKSMTALCMLLKEPAYLGIYASSWCIESRLT